MKYTLTIKIDVSIDNATVVKQQIKSAVLRVLDNATFLTGKPELLKSLTIKQTK